jgi:hypothetical protein
MRQNPSTNLASFQLCTRIYYTCRSIVFDDTYSTNLKSVFTEDSHHNRKMAKGKKSSIIQSVHIQPTIIGIGY